MTITDPDTLARAIFMADNSNAPDPAAEWDRAVPHHRAYAHHIAEAIAPQIREAQRVAWDEGNDAGNEDSAHWDGYQMDPGHTEHTNPYRTDTP